MAVIPLRPVPAHTCDSIVFRLIALTALFLGLALPAPLLAQSGPRWVVGPGGTHAAIADALRDASPGDTVEVRGGLHPRLVVNKSVTLVGVDNPVIDGGGDGTVVEINAPDVGFRGFVVRGSGVQPDLDHGGITINAPRGRIERNVLRDVLFGVYASKADGTVISDNDITGKPELDESRQGDAVRLWYSHNVRIERNHVHRSRDVVVWYSDGVSLRDNLVERGRYGIHLMYAGGNVIENNVFVDNSVGIYTMYSRDVRITGNVLRGHRGPSGYALGFKEVDDVEVAGNTLVDNRGGLFLDGTPFTPNGTADVHDNIVAFNDAGAIIMPSTRHARFSGNTFWENVEQVTVHGGGSISGNEWRGNTWSDYTGFDADRDGLGDVPYRSDRMFESLTDRAPALRAFIYSPAAQAIEFAGAAMPIIRPQPKLSDPSPRMEAAPPPASARPAQAQALGMAAVGAALLAAGAALALPAWRARPPSKPRPALAAGRRSP